MHIAALSALKHTAAATKSTTFLQRREIVETRERHYRGQYEFADLEIAAFQFIRCVTAVNLFREANGSPEEPITNYHRCLKCLGNV